MPLDQSTAKRPPRHRRSATESTPTERVDPKSSNIYHNASVHDRIKQWQAHGAAGAPAPDAVSVLSAPRSDVYPTPETVRSMSPAEENWYTPSGTTKDRQARKTTSNKTKHSQRVRSSSTPRKRVVSDEHWKSRTSQKRNKSPGEDPIQDNDVVSPESPPPKTATPRSIGEARREREERRRRRLEARSHKVRVSAEAPEKDTKIESPSEHKRRSDIENVEPENEVSVGSGKVTPSNHSPRESLSPFEIDIDHEPPQTDDMPQRKSKYVETLGQAPPSYAQDAQLRSKKGSFLNKTKEVLGISNSVPVVSNRLPSIEAWLYDQPDPFVDETSATVPELELQKPKKPRSVRRKPSNKSPLPDPNEIWQSLDIDNKDVHQEPPPEQKHSFTDQIEPSSPTTLKRRGARPSRPKRHTLPHVPQDISQNSENDLHDIRSGSSVKVEPHGQGGSPPYHPTRLSTIASVETFHDEPPAHENSTVPDSAGLKRRPTTHEDMMSVLSRPRSSRGTRKKRSVKISNPSNSDVVKDILSSIAKDEARYSRELKTLVDGVVPVLLQCVLSKTDAVAASGMFTHSANTNNDLAFTRPIIDMGVALERLKSLHNRIPLHNVDNLISWCQTAHKAYSEYVKAWRLGFQDVVVNLAPLEDSEADNNEVMERDDNGDIINADGNKVDVAYLLKRPLVQIRKLGRALNSLKEKLPDHPVAIKISDDYNELTQIAKNKHQQEKGRLEDEAAAYVDATKCRDIRTMAPLLDVDVDKSKRVRARDCFNMTLYQSSGQRMDCRIELILRDNSHKSPDGGDLLICQVDESGKWLLFAPTDVSLVSSRKGEAGCDLVVMIRGKTGMAQEWFELLALNAEDSEAAGEWMAMLGSNPLPPKLSRVPSFVDLSRKTAVAPITEDVTSTKPKPKLERIPSIETIDIPIGEPSVLGVVATHLDEKKQSETKTAVESKPQRAPVFEKPLSQLSLGGGLTKKPIPEHWQAQMSVLGRKPVAPSIHSSDRSSISGYSAGSSTKFAPSSLSPMDRSHQQLHQQPQHVQHKQRYEPQVIEPHKRTSSSPPKQSHAPSKSVAFKATADEVHASPMQPRSQSIPEPELKNKAVNQPLVPPPDLTPKRPVLQRAPSSAPSSEPPVIPKIRDPESKPSGSSIALTESIRDTWATLSGFGRKAVSQPTTPVGKPDLKSDDITHRGGRLSEPPTREDFDTISGTDVEDEQPPPPPQHRNISVPSPRTRTTPILRPSEAQQKMDKKNNRLSSSPLRREYAPSSPSASPSSAYMSDSGSSSDDESQTSEDFESELFDTPMPLNSVPGKHFVPSGFARSVSVPTTGTRTLAPSDSASQGPYRKVPSSAERPDVVRKRAVAMICSWSDSGQWTPLRDEYCSIVVSPGLIEAFPMDEAHSGGPATNQDPLAAFELTPIVPLRKSTGLDISIRSPPTANSQIKTTNNVMFRSHSALECENLYQMIHWARCNNRTYLELERSRPRPQPVVTFSNEEAPRARSWFSFGGGVKRRNSYRVGNVPPSSMGDSQATTNTVSSAFSALKRLSISSAFNVNRSSVVQRPGLASHGSLYSSSNGTGGSGSGSSTPQPSQLGIVPGKEGPNVPLTSAAAVNGGGMVHNMKIKLLVRKGRDWMPLGASRLSVLPAANRNKDTPETSRPGSSGSITPDGAETPRRASGMSIQGSTTLQQQRRQYRLSSSNNTPHRFHGDGREKRILITRNGKPDQVILDVILPESCFEKIAHLGIAMQVWKEDEDVRQRGGVVMGKNELYMMQFYHQQDSAWVFGLVGSYRYSNVMTAQ